MKKINLFLTLIFLTTSMFTACKSDEPSIYKNTPEKIGVEINGVVWSPYNVGVSCKFVSKAEDYGGLYQWNRKDTANFLLGYDYCISDFPTASSWLLDNDPSPIGWRVPNGYELSSLLDTTKVSSEWTTENSIAGRRFTDKITRKSIFLPAAGCREYVDGVLSFAGESGGYWISSRSEVFTTSAHILQFSNSFSVWGVGFCAYGFSVRPVAE